MYMCICIIVQQRHTQYTNACVGTVVVVVVFVYPVTQQIVEGSKYVGFHHPFFRCFREASDCFSSHRLKKSPVGGGGGDMIRGTGVEHSLCSDFYPHLINNNKERKGQKGGGETEIKIMRNMNTPY